MYLGERTEHVKHKRKSKLGKYHIYSRKTTFVLLRCDSCDNKFERARRQMDPKRLNNNYFHVCDSCDAKRFAQKRGVDRRKVWQLTASSSIPIGKI